MSIEKQLSALMEKYTQLQAENEQLKEDACPSWMGKEKGCNEAEDYAKIQAENTELLEANSHYVEVCNENAELKAEKERQREALERIQRWQQAYPVKMFPKPDLKKAQKVLKAAGMTLDAISADNMRHVLDGIKNIVKTALKGE